MNSNTYKVVIHYMWIIISALFYLGWFKAESLNEIEDVFNKLCKLVFSDRCSIEDCNKVAYTDGYCGEHCDKTGRENRCNHVLTSGKRKGEACGFKCKDLTCLKHTEHKKLGEFNHNNLPNYIRFTGDTKKELEELKKLNRGLIDRLRELTKERDSYSEQLKRKESHYEHQINGFKEKIAEIEYEKEADSIRNKTIGINTPNTPSQSFYSPAIEGARKFTPMNELSIKVIDSKVENALDYDENSYSDSDNDEDDEDDDDDEDDGDYEYGVPGDKVDIDLIKRATSKYTNSMDDYSYNDVDNATSNIISIYRDMDRKDVNLNKAFKKLYNVFLESMERNYLENIQDKAYRKEQRSYHRGELDDTLRLIGTRDVKQ